MDAAFQSLPPCGDKKPGEYFLFQSVLQSQREQRPMLVLVSGNVNLE